MEDYRAGDKIIPDRVLASFKGEQLEMIAATSYALRQPG